MIEEENWLRLTSDNKERYQFPGWHDTSVGSVLYYADNVTDLPQYSGDHHLWHDIQFSKAGTTKNTMSVVINEKKVNLSYWMSQCNGVKQCKECDHVLSNSCLKNNCKSHSDAPLQATGSCIVKFVYVYPVNSSDKR